jgi:AcrR family transcriptional regulator
MKKEKKRKNEENINETKNLIIDCAAKLIAEYGYAKVTSKSICEKAKVNMAAINYHFGSREGLYIEILNKVHEHMLDADELTKILLSDFSAKEKVDLYIDTFIESLYTEHNWYLKVWAREVINSSEIVNEILLREALPRFNIVLKIFSEYTKLPITDHRLYSCILISFSPFIITFLAPDTENLLPVKYSREELISHLKYFIFAGLDKLREN